MNGTKPMAPANLTATAGDQQVSLHWSPSLKAKSYSVYRRPASATEGDRSLIRSGLKETCFTDSGLTNGSPYCYIVLAINARGKESDPSNEVSATPQGQEVVESTITGGSHCKMVSGRQRQPNVEDGMGPAANLPPLPRWIILAIDVITAIKNRALTPDFLTEDTLLLFRRFKDAYDSKDAVKLADEISDKFRGNFYGRQSKAELANFFADVFNSILWGVYPSLSITIYHVIQKDTGAFKAVLEFQSQLKVLGAPVAGFDSGRVVCEARPEGPYGIWRIRQMDHAR
jgi:hypothetical protein